LGSSNAISFLQMGQRTVTATGSASRFLLSNGYPGERALWRGKDYERIEA
jgi:hypothetical protein